MYTSVYNHNGLEKGHVVHLDSYYGFSDEGAQPCFKFNHPNKNKYFNPDKSNSHNLRTNHIKWTAETDAICHGFAGYFSAKLSQNVICSITPQNHTEGMSSWFPLFLPLLNPVNIRAKETLGLVIKRLTKPNRVWYEWAVEVRALHSIKNENKNKNSEAQLPVEDSEMKCGEIMSLGPIHNAGGHAWSQIF